jgi:predicted ATP-grasp superfamily ATP-dependent carboligase
LIEFSRAGNLVSIVCPNYEPSRKVRVAHHTFPYKSLTALDSLADAIEASKPDMIVPCDDLGVRHLHRLHASERARQSRVDIPALIVRSLGPPESYTAVASRYPLLKIAHDVGIRAPETRVVANFMDLKKWHSEQPFPWVLKADGTTGGRGVRIVHTLAEAQGYISDLRRSRGLPPLIKRVTAERDWFLVAQWWEGRSAQPETVVQSYVRGCAANCAVVCWQGEVLAGVGCEVVSTQWPAGPANVIRLVDNAEMMDAAGLIARRLGLSGFFGLDFMIEEGSGAAYLIEMNPRCTPLCHLRLGNARDMIGALSARLTGATPTGQVSITENNQIAYFPHALLRNSEFLSTSYHDVPEGEQELIQELLRTALLPLNRGVRGARAVRSLLSAALVRGRRALVGVADTLR